MAWRPPLCCTPRSLSPVSPVPWACTASARLAPSRGSPCAEATPLCPWLTTCPPTQQASVLVRRWASGALGVHVRPPRSRSSCSTLNLYVPEDSWARGAPGLGGEMQAPDHCAHPAPSATLASFLAWAPQVFAHCLQSSSPATSSTLTPVSLREAFSRPAPCRCPHGLTAVCSPACACRVLAFLSGPSALRAGHVVGARSSTRGLVKPPGWRPCPALPGVNAQSRWGPVPAVPGSSRVPGETAGYPGSHRGWGWRRRGQESFSTQLPASHGCPGVDCLLVPSAVPCQGRLSCVVRGGRS